jgi:hypothetical protein
MGVCGLDSSGPGWGPVRGCSEHGGEIAGFIKGGKFLVWLGEGLLLGVTASEN